MPANPRPRRGPLRIAPPRRKTGPLPELSQDRQLHARHAWRKFAGASELSTNGPRPSPLSRAAIAAIGAGIALGTLLFGVQQAVSDDDDDNDITTAVAPSSQRAPAPAVDRPDPMRPPSSSRRRGAVLDDDPASARTEARVPSESRRTNTDAPNNANADATPTPAPTPTPIAEPASAVPPPEPDRAAPPPEPEPPSPATVEPNEANDLRAQYGVPRGESDGAPLGKVAEHGLHVDRLAVGSKFARSWCGDERGAFSLSEHDEVNVCFRAVHLRERQHAYVSWEHDGKVVRRTYMTIPARHAYRNRAVLRLRPTYAGKWRVRVLSAGGLELASARFVVSTR